ncbi:YL-1 PROTEIN TRANSCRIPTION FACTOR-LIKE 1 [Salix koriyanagi]|uniref:YL-1 PROTEIN TRANSCRIPTION FACTOR-LIKE 1 n=1 Tax=Salix koriyanagi TaxID=2511006 RepID=A0A9Q1AM55_9ROSI|nr:YL-1 PROTEIN TRANSCRIPTION FACTOR-LIKE 1 [Salix koriyanagi]
MEVSKEDDSLVLLDRASRPTRGKRMTKLIDDELEEDELFWNQDALKDEEEDDNYQEEAEVADEFDSDFDVDEPEPDEEAEKEVEERPHNKKRLIFPGKTLPKKKTKKKDLSKLDKLSMNEKSIQEPASPDHQDAPDDVEGERIVRKSTRTSVVVRQAERDAIRAALQATMKPIKRKKEGEEKRMTQEEMLLEAAQTEIVNIRNLERVLAREEEVKKRAIVHKAVYSGPQIRYFSKNGCSYLEFKGLSFQSQLSTTSVPYPEKSICAVTGLPAKYNQCRKALRIESISVYKEWGIVIQKTGQPYATKEAFKIIRERFMDENNNIKKMAMGDLFDSLVGTGFHGKRKRLPISNRRSMSHLPRFANFGRTPVVDIESSE